ncbi:MAG: DUF4159 domain-containing protein [Rhodothermaceae bacterium]|nr:DUF4159 domain-containing protein [Rhodothermaceae bacterium]
MEFSNNRLFTFSLLYLIEHGDVAFTDLEVTPIPPAPSAGGFLHIDDNYGLDEAIRKEMEKVIP